MKLHFLGTNGWFSDKNGDTICTLLETKDYYIVFDAGNSIYKLDKYIKKEKPVILFLSHLHLDHIFGFHILIKFKFKKDLTIFCPRGTKKHLEKFINHPFAIPFKKMRYKISIKELREGKHKVPFPVECKKLVHIDLTFGYRIFVDNKTITYLCDTGLCENAKILAKNADILIHECSLSHAVSNDDWGHVGPKGAALVAKKSNAKKLFITHFSAGEYSTIKDREKALKSARKIFKKTYCAKDNLSVNI